MHIKTLNTIVYCQNWQACVDFYQKKLLLPVLYANQWFVEFELNSTARLSVADESRASIKSSHGVGITITLEVDDINDTHRYLTAADVNPTAIKQHAWNAKVIHIFDPEGTRIEFWAKD
ncbi:MAG: VOC family protein [Oceanospirillaceae bacterium]